VQRVYERYRAKFVAIDQTFPEICRFFSFKMANLRHLGFVVREFGALTKSIWWSLSPCTVWLEWNSSFDNRQFFIFCEFGLKMPIQAHFEVGDFTPK